MPSINGTILQYFHSYLPINDRLWTSLNNRIPAIAQAGFSAVWLPATYSISQQDGLDELLPETWLSEHHTELGSNGSVLQYSTGGKLVAAVKELQARGLQVYADIVFHGESGILRDQLQDWSRWFLEVTGVNGFRLDAAIDLPFDTINNWLHDLTPDGLFNFGEYWLGDAGPLQWFLQELGDCLCLLDVPLHYNFHHASQAGNQYDLRHILDGSLVQRCPTAAVTFVDNHHSQPLEMYDSVVEAWFKPLAYALILLRHEGYPSVFYGDYYGALYEGIGGDGCTYSIVLDSHQWILDRLMQLRYQYAYGEQQDYFDNPSSIGWTRLGDEAHPTAIAAVISNGGDCSKWMQLYRPHTTFKDALGHVDHPVVTDAWGWGEFFCPGRSLAVWVEQGG